MAHPRAWLLCVLLAAHAFPAPASAAVSWLSSVDEALALARAQKKLVLLEIISARNPACAERERFYEDARLQAALPSFVPVRLDADRESAHAERWDPAGYPTLIVLQADAKEVARPLGSLAAGALAERLEEILKDEHALLSLRGRLAKEPDHVASQLDLARVLLRRNNAEESQPLVEKLSHAPDPAVRDAMPSLLLSLAMALGKGGPTPQGREHFERITREFPDSREAEQAHFLLGMLYFMQGDRAASARSLEKVLKTSHDEYLRERAERALRRVKPAKQE
ncbi:MAG: tetratricopeptide repeat protein [Armatimonadetes bacterium]|nr:tetratricopeptide repeat protein [Armatimonadota bacterium]